MEMIGALMSVLVMTATIRPPVNAIALARTNVDQRLSDYRLGLHHNLALLRRGVFSGLVFVDNSGFGTEDLQDGIGPDEVEFISYDGKLGERVETRFAGECRLLRTAFERSQTIGRAGEGRVWKVTGRYVVRNLSQIVSDCYGTSDLVVHCRNRPTRFVDFGVAGFRASSGAEIMDRVLRVPDIETKDEVVIRNMIEGGAFADLRVAQRFSQIPDFSGVRGSDASSYDGVAYRMKYLARVGANRVFPRLWI